MEVFVSHCDKNYSSRAIAMARSILRYTPESKLIMVYQDNETKQAFEGFSLENTELVSIEQLISEFPELRQVRENRSKIEFYFSITPFLLKYGALGFPNEVISYVDADILFFCDPSDGIQEIQKNHSARLVPHRFKQDHMYLEKYGKYNVGIVSYNPKFGTKAIDWWAESCIRSTSIFPTAEVFGDQKYLDEFERVDPSVLISKHLGENVAPWNLLELELAHGEQGPKVLGSPLVYFHFSGLKLFQNFAALGFAGYSKKPGKQIWKQIYKPYIKEIRAIEQKTGLSSQMQFKNLTWKLWIRELYFNDLKIILI